MKENRQKALKETDPIKKQALIAEIEADGELLKQKYREHQEHSNKYKFNPSQRISDMVEAMKRAIERSNRGGSGGGDGGRDPTKPRKPNGQGDPLSDDD